MAYLDARRKYEAEPKQDNDEYAKLLCSVPNCGRLWSVRVDKPMCSKHQWGDNPFKSNVKATKPPTDLRQLLKTPAIKSFVEKDDDVGF